MVPCRPSRVWILAPIMLTVSVLFSASSAFISLAAFFALFLRFWRWLLLPFPCALRLIVGMPGGASISSLSAPVSMSLLPVVVAPLVGDASEIVPDSCAPSLMPWGETLGARSLESVVTGWSPWESGIFRATCGGCGGVGMGWCLGVGCSMRREFASDSSFAFASAR